MQETENKISAAKNHSIKIPKGVLDDDDIALLEIAHGPVRESEDFLIFTNEQWEGLFDCLENNPHLTLDEISSKGFAVRAAAKLVRLVGDAKTTSDTAACLAGVIAMFPLAPEVANRLLASIK